MAPTSAYNALDDPTILEAGAAYLRAHRREA